MIKNIILTLILISVAGAAILYLYKAKKRGENCIGCPYAKKCRKKPCNTDMKN